MPDALTLTLRLAEKFGLNVYVNTSGYFGKSIDRAFATLAQYPRFRHLEISIDRYHEAFVPRRFALNTAKAAYRLGLEVQFALQKEEWETDPALRAAIAEFPWASKYIQQLVDVGESIAGSGSRPIFAGPKGGCTKVGTLLFDEYGYAYPCCGTAQMARRTKGSGLPGFSLGSIHDLDFSDIVARLRDSRSLSVIHKIGPTALASFLDIEESCPGRGSCNICLDLHVNGHVKMLAEPGRKALMDFALGLGSPGQ